MIINRNRGHAYTLRIITVILVMKTILVFDDLRIFVVAAKLGSLSKAADHLEIAQPALSRRLKRLELKIGTELMRRSAKGVYLTHHGSRLFSRVHLLVDGIADIERDFVLQVGMQSND